MTKDPKKRIHLIFSILLSISIIVAGICFMVACMGIYRSGDQPYSRESVAAAFGPISFPVYLCLGMVVIGFLLDLFLPEDSERPKVQKQYATTLKRLRERTDLSRCGDDLRAAIESQQKKRRLHRRLSGILLIIGSVIFLTYALNPSHFHQSQINDSMIRAMYWLIPCMAVPFGYGVFSAFYSVSSIRREIELIKQAGPEAKIQAVKEPVKDRTKATNALRCVVLGVAVAALVYGFCAGGTADVLTKAINICTECVGLG